MNREEFICSNLGLVHSCANRFRDKGIEYDDLYSAGCLGLVKAVDGFKCEMGYRFSTYAVPVILGEIKKLFREGGAVKVSRSLKDRARLALKEKERLEALLEREPTVAELADALGCDSYEASELLCVNLAPLSLTSADGESDRQLDIPSDSYEEQIHNSLAIEQVIASLDEDDRRLIRLRYFGGCTQSVTAKSLGISQVQVSRRERVLLESLRRKLSG